MGGRKEEGGPLEPTQGTEVAEEIQEVGSVTGNVSESATLKWIPAEGADFPVYKAVYKPVKFRYWASMVQLDPNWPEVASLIYLNQHVEIAADIVSWVLWAIVNIRMDGNLPFPDTVANVSPLLCPKGMKYQDLLWPNFHVSLSS